ncbi:FliI/YscN family ATPase [Veronia pacifica]|uniref:protein-secreting ATPase n=1 Tax=Veronia pacifica TaxID=1080227 RepID=A0A1C3ER07_9GAMM|nr:FliI/YscN family ATPase [Veronia pacifica]ODA35667.1 flagellum-specific ATP synthase FliL [Veronia pacifica]
MTASAAVIDEKLNAITSLLSENKHAYSAVQVRGKVIGVVGTLIRCKIPQARIGDLCEILPGDYPPILSEVVSFDDDTVLLSALSAVDGIASGDLIRPFFVPHSLDLTIPVFGQMFDGFGRPLGESNRTIFCEQKVSVSSPVMSEALNPLEKPRIDQAFPTGIRTIDAFNTIGKGQRLGIFAGPGCGKSTLMAQIARGCSSDAIVFGLVGERGRELNEFIEHELDADLRAKSIFVCATSDKTSMERARAAFTATAVAEALRDQGKNVLLLIDSLTRFARAQREIGLAAGEPPGRAGFPPSVFSLMPRMLERAGPAKIGSITAFYTVLVEKNITADPISDEARSLLDGHLVLSREMAEKGHFPALDVLQSLSRTMTNVVSPEHEFASTTVRKLLSTYKENELLIRLGEYQQGSDPNVDIAVSLNPHIMQFTRQSREDLTDFNDTVNAVGEIARAGAGGAG